VIGQPALREVVGPDPLRAVAAADLRAAIGGAGTLGPAALEVEEPRAQHFHGKLAVAVLRLLARGHDDAARDMGDPNRRVGGVHVLAARARGTHRVDADVVRIDLHVDRLGLGQHGDGRRRCVDAAAALGLGHALHPMHAALIFQPGEDALALDPRHDFLDAAKLGRLLLDDLEAPAARIGIALIHPQQVGGEKRGLVAPRAGPDLDHRGPRIGGILGQEREAQRRFGRLQPLAQPRKLLFGEVAHLRIAQHRLRLGDFGREAGVLGGGLDHRLEFRVFPAQLGDLAARGAGRHLRLDELEAGGDLVDLVLCDHGSPILHRPRGVK